MKKIHCLIGLLLAFGCGVLHAASADKPNVILIFVDDLGYGDIGPFGSEIPTVHLDKMAAEGMKFTSFYATPVCSMSRASLMTGCYNTRISVPGVLFPASKIGLNPDETTIAEVLKSRGYATTAIGKWHLGHLDPFMPTAQGFDSFFGIPYSNDMSIDKQHARFAKDCVFREGMNESLALQKPRPNTVPLMRGTEIVEYPADQSTLTKRYTQEAVKFIREHQTQPFFLYLPHTMVHVPLAVSDEFRGKSGKGLYGDAVQEIDWSVGQILQTLKELELDDKTLVIFSSDNGGDVGSSLPWRGKKATTYEGGVRVPCIMRWPGRIPAGTACPHIAGNIDVLPTFAALTGAQPPQDRVIDGRDISSMMLRADAPPVRDTQLHFSREGELAAIRQGDWKLHLKAPQRKAKAKQAAKQVAQDDAGPFTPVLYHLAKDPGETSDVAAQNPDVVARLSAEADQRLQEITKNIRPAGQISGADAK